ncbi:MAG: response regulator [Pyrinomonadaceae bacterium]|nr:response regulator [Sphingobacteriaceae bacterium]
MTKRVLVIEDEQSNRQSLEIVLRHHGYEVTSSENGADIISLLNSLKPDLVILDMLLKGYDGRLICQEIKKSSKFKNIPVIMMSGHSDIYNTIAEDGANDVLVKPYTEISLISRIERQIGGSRRLV